MTAFDLQFIIPGVLSILLGLILFFWNGLDSILSDKENNKKSIKYKRYFWAAFCIILGILTIIGRILDWPVAGYIISPP